MRVIKFRLVDKLEKRIIDLVGFVFETPTQIRFWYKGGEFLVNESIAAHNADIIQFSGLLDKNGKEIYDGDIIKNGDYIADADAWNEWETEVKWDNGEARFLGMDGESMEVIGNIYENPII
jgi:hypothetical protein